MRKIAVAIIILFASITLVSAQDYNWAVGGRFGGEMSGVTVKHNFDASNALETILAIPYDDGFAATLLYEKHVPVIGPGFNFYYGAGAHVGKWDKKFSFGGDVIIGLDYKIKNAPVALSIDYKPVFNIVSRTKFYMLDFALGLKIVF